MDSARRSKGGFVRLGTLGERGLKIAAFAMLIAIAVLGNDVLSDLGRRARSPKTNGSSEQKKADLSRKNSTEAAPDPPAKEIDDSILCPCDETDRLLADLFDLFAQAPCEETCLCADSIDGAFAGCACPVQSYEIPSGIVTADAFGIPEQHLPPPHIFTHVSTACCALPATKDLPIAVLPSRSDVVLVSARA